MQFAKLRLQGFKSFVDPTELVISDGLTGVVGPNGCGKSNLLEALRWVMGENSPKSMRGEGMEDVIFAGASARTARHFAEVGLIIDNSDRRAPVEFNHEDNLEVIRRITRDAGSAYKANGREVRARDVRMLFADAATGAHSPSLVRQGQIGELINAKPKARRAILEDAAGIGGLYQRRHEAELKLRAAEVNMARVGDVLESLDQRLAALIRQARQAARYREIAGELRTAEALLLYIRWREADRERLAADGALTEAVRAAAALQGRAAEAATTRLKAEAATPPLREEEAIAGAVLQRLLVERDALNERERQARADIERMGARIRQLTADVERETALSGDADEMLARLDWEETALGEAAEGHEEKLAGAQEKARAAAAELQGRESGLDQLSEDAARLAARRQAAERRLEETRAARRKLAAEADEAREGVEALGAEITGAEAMLAGAAAAADKARTAAAAAEVALESAETERADAQGAEAETRARLSEADGEAGALRAETGALERLLRREAGEGAQLLDSVRAARGFEAALGAALADDLRAPAIGPEGASGWAALPNYDAPQGLPETAEPLAGRVTAPDVLARRLGQIGLVARADGPRLQPALKPGQRLVSVEGDLWRWDGFRAGAEDAPSAAALRLQQQNRLDDLLTALTEAEAGAEAARAAHQAGKSRLETASAREAEARAARRAADQAMTDAGRALSRAEADLDMRRGKLEALRLTAARRAEEANAARAALEEAEGAMGDLGDLDAARAAVEAAKFAVEGARRDMMEARAAADETRREGEARARRRGEIVKERAGWTNRRDNAAGRIGELRARIEETEAEKAEAEIAPAEIAGRREALIASISKAEARCKAAAEALATGEAALREAERGEREAERAASEARERKARLEAVAEAAAERVAEAAHRIAEATEQTPESLLESLDADPDAAANAEALELEIVNLRRKRDALGAVNLRAEEDAKEVEAERGDLGRERDDLAAAIDKLRHGIANLNSEGRHRLLAAFETVNANFSVLFKHLFGGGEANLALIESEDPLDAGLEIMCMPPGKKLSTLSLLSGGEQTLTALSLIFAVFLANPSPICVLDEVDAPLDDANVSRFCDLLDEMTRRTETRFLIITHNALTMSRMDRLYGVTMAEKGVSQLVSVDLSQAEEMVEAA